MCRLEKGFVDERKIIGRFGNKSIIEHISRKDEIDDETREIMECIDDSIDRLDVDFIINHVKGMLLHDHLGKINSKPLCPYFMEHINSFYLVYGNNAFEMVKQVSEVYNKVKERRNQDETIHSVSSNE